MQKSFQTIEGIIINDEVEIAQTTEQSERNTEINIGEEENSKQEKRVGEKMSPKERAKERRLGK